MYQTQMVEVAPGEVSTADFDVPANLACVEGVVTTNGVPETAAMVIFKQESSEEPAGTAMPDAQGYYKISLFEGTYSLDVYRSRPGYGNSATKGYATVQAVADQTVRLDISFVGGVIEGTLAGLKPGEKGYVALFPGDTNVPQWTLQAIESLGNRILRQLDVPSNGPFLMEDVEPGFYVLGAAAIPIDAPPDASAFLNAGLAVAPVEVQSGERTTVELVIE
jgi:hypothetical protein